MLNAPSSGYTNANISKTLFSIVTILHSFVLLLAIVLLFKSVIVLLSLNVFDYLDLKFLT